MKRLFNEENDSYLPEGLVLCTDIENALKPVLEVFFAQGYSKRDVEYVGIQTISNMCLEAILSE